MNSSEQNQVSVETTSKASSGQYTSPPPIGYPTREAMVGDPPAAAVETTSKGVPIQCLEGLKKCLCCCLEDLTAA
ncbi:unnamed protein product [Cochlearia groenlandica]